MVLSSGAAIYLIESPHEDAQIKNLIDAFWWASATVTTVGYGDVVPVTEAGRILGIAFRWYKEAYRQKNFKNWEFGKKGTWYSYKYGKRLAHGAKSWFKK